MATEFVPEMKSDKQAAEIARLREQVQVLREALKSAVLSLEQFVKFNRIPENNQGLRDARAAIAKAEGK